MIREVIKYLKIPAQLLAMFLVYWFLNSGFSADPVWLVVQAAIFTILSFVIVRYKIKLFFWFFVIGLLYLLSAIFEIHTLPAFSVVAASTGFGVLVIVLAFQVLTSIRRR